nr:tetratricopeptide repeat protein 36 isoform X2 [Pelodiscus sinensis]|eukprot:XP_025039351.1 tetratricopeptide repeat protein 36 isoform X2 [Pelodiscus sinensis]
MATSKDRAVLQAILNPSAPFGDILGFAEEEEAAAVQGEEGAFTSELLEQVKELELQGVLAAESGDVNRALEKFSQAIQLLPERASCYNNRAQAFRLKGDVAAGKFRTRSCEKPSHLRTCPGCGWIRSWSTTQKVGILSTERTFPEPKQAPQKDPVFNFENVVIRSQL